MSRPPRPAQPRLKRFFAALPPGGKLLALCILSLITFYSSNLWFLAALSLAAPLLFLLCGFSLRDLWRQLRLFAVFSLCLSIFQLFNSTAAMAAADGLRLFGLTASAVFISAVTAGSALLRALERCLKIFAPLGLNPRQTALALALVLRFLPLLQQTYAELRQAQKARDSAKLRLRGQTQLLSLTLMRLIEAQENIAEAIAARGFEAAAAPTEKQLQKKKDIG